VVEAVHQREFLECLRRADLGHGRLDGVTRAFVRCDDPVDLRQDSVRVATWFDFRESPLHRVHAAVECGPRGATHRFEGGHLRKEAYVVVSDHPLSTWDFASKSRCLSTPSSRSLPGLMSATTQSVHAAPARSGIGLGAAAGLFSTLLVLLTVAGTSVYADETSFSSHISQDEWRELAKVATDAELASWLLDDDIKWNGTAAAAELFDRIEDPERYRSAVASLWPLMDLDDAQAVDVAAGLLQQACIESHPGLPVVTPDDRLMAYAVKEAMRYRGYLWYPDMLGRCHPIGAVRFCMLYAVEVRPWLVEALRTPLEFDEEDEEYYSIYGIRSGEKMANDAEMHTFMAAYLLSFAPGAVPIEEVVAAIVPRLECNLVNYDALMGMAALGRYGPDAAGPCRIALERSTDRQQRACLEMLLAHWDWPRDSALRESAVDSLQELSLTWKVRDPILDWHFELQVR
jgi:hypothetical protein